MVGPTVLSIALSLSLSHTLTHTHTHSVTHSLTHTQTQNKRVVDLSNVAGELWKKVEATVLMTTAPASREGAPLMIAAIPLA